MVEHLRFSGENQEGTRAARDVLRFQVGRGVPLQGKTEAEEEADGQGTVFIIGQCDVFFLFVPLRDFI